jgi:hypothetical protein
VNRDALEEFFAKADDVLTDWPGSPDAMSTSMEAPKRQARSWRMEVNTPQGWVEIGGVTRRRRRPSCAASAARSTPPRPRRCSTP